MDYGLAMCLGLLTTGWFVLQAAADFLPGILGSSGRVCRESALGIAAGHRATWARHLVYSFSCCPPPWRVLLSPEAPVLEMQVQRVKIIF